jgi:hypothetical protein
MLVGLGPEKMDNSTKKGYSYGQIHGKVVLDLHSTRGYDGIAQDA